MFAGFVLFALLVVAAYLVLAGNKQRVEKVADNHNQNPPNTSKVRPPKPGGSGGGQTVTSAAPVMQDAFGSRWVETRPGLYVREGNLSELRKVTTAARAGSGDRYVYCFSIWPDETWGFDRAVFDLFRMLTGKVEMEFTPEAFEDFRSRLSHHGLTLREVERVPYHQPESVV